MADLDAYDEVAETSKTDNESAPLAGVYKGSDGGLYIFTPTTGPSESVDITNGTVAGTLNVTVNSVPYTFSGVSYIYATTYRAADSVSVSSQVQVSFTDFNVASGDTDVGFYLSAANSGPTELDIQAAIDAVHGGTGGGSLQLSAVEGANLMQVWDAPQNGNLLPIAVDGLIQTWDFSSTGQVDQSVWITQAPGASDGQVLCQVAVPGNRRNGVTQAVTGLTGTNTPKFLTVLPNGKTVNAAGKTWFGPTDTPIDPSKPRSPSQVGQVMYLLKFGTPGYAVQHVRDNGQFIIHYHAVADDSGTGGSDSGTGGDGSSSAVTTLAVDFSEEYWESWYENSILNPQSIDQHAHSISKPVQYFMGLNNIKFEVQGDKLMLVRTGANGGVLGEVTEWFSSLEATFTMQVGTYTTVPPVAKDGSGSKTLRSAIQTFSR